MYYFLVVNQYNRLFWLKAGTVVGPRSRILEQMAEFIKNIMEPQHTLAKVGKRHRFTVLVTEICLSPEKLEYKIQRACNLFN